MTRAIGIDLGTTNSVIASVNSAGTTEVLADREGATLIPSMVLFDDEHAYVGEEARLRGRLRPERLAACVKREMGLAFYSQAIDGEHLPPEVIQAIILHKVQQEIKRTVGDDTGVVIAVPAFFNELQRHATTVAGKLAGLNVVGLLNESMAALLAMREQMDFLRWGAQAERMHFLVYDLGGYTFEATLLEVHDGNFTTLATERDVQLGGHDWDLRLIDHLAEQFIRQHGSDPRDCPASLMGLLHRATTAKLALGEHPQVEIHFKHQEKKLSLTLTREQFAELGADLLQRTADICHRVLAGQGLTWTDVPRVILVGGASQMPFVRTMLLQRTKIEPLRMVHPEEAVARGAAVYAAKILAREEQADKMDFRVCNVSAHSLGIEGLDPKRHTKVNKILIPRGTPLPAKVTRDFVTKANAQKSITIVVLEGEDSDPAKCCKVGRAVLTNLPEDLSQDWPIEVTYAYDAAGKLSVDARVRYTEHAVHLEIRRESGMSPAQLELWQRVIAGGGGMVAIHQAIEADQTERRRRPIAMRSSAEDDGHEHASVLSLLRRYMPFVFGRSDGDAA